jgi:hypothetical protein
MATIYVCASIIFINIIFGYWRSNTQNFSFQWFLAIHIPVPVAIILRLTLLGWSWLMLPVFVGAFAAGQFAGGVIRRFLRKKRSSLGSFLISDLFVLLIAGRRPKNYTDDAS